MGKYRIYIDESGDSGLKSSSNPNHRYLSITGIIINLDYIRNFLFDDMEQLKRKYFGSHPDEPIIFHRKDMVNKRNDFRVLKDADIEYRFNNELLEKLTTWDYVIVTIFIDKKDHLETYNRWKYEPYHYCLAAILERYCWFLKRINETGDVMVESRGKNEDIRLRNSFSRIYREGTNVQSNPDWFSSSLTSRELKVNPKKDNITGLQLADIIAHPSWRYALSVYGLLDITSDTFGARIIESIKDKYYKHNGKLLGCGIKKLNK